MTSLHYTKDREAREQIIKMIGNGKPIANFIVDKGHKNGPEIHEITDTAIINIYNKRTHKLITKLIARPGQIKRYYKNGNAPKDLLDKAYDNMKKGFNKWLRTQTRKHKKKEIIDKE